MKVLIVENEIYLAQSISTKLTEFGYICEIATNTKEALKDEYFDAVLLSTNISGQNFYPVIERYKGSIILLLISYISNDTVSKPLKSGASDYIQKPFMVEELVRKLKHLKLFNMLREKNKTYEDYINFLFEDCKFETPEKRNIFPALLKTNKQQLADNFVFSYSKLYEKNFIFISLNSSDYISKITSTPDHLLMYLVGLQNINNYEKNKIFNLIENKKVFISTTDINEKTPFEEFKILTSETRIDGSSILSIDDYVKYIITTYQSKFPDTELSKKLGISRKSIWTKRKQYGITKK